MRAHMKLTAKTHRTFTQLVAPTDHQRGKAGLGRSLTQGHRLFAKTGTPIGVGEKNNAQECLHG